jgi:hypothetical protein
VSPPGAGVRGHGRSSMQHPLQPARERGLQSPPPECDGHAVAAAWTGRHGLPTQAAPGVKGARRERDHPCNALFHSPWYGVFSPREPQSRRGCRRSQGPGVSPPRRASARGEPGQATASGGGWVSTRHGAGTSVPASPGADEGVGDPRARNLSCSSSQVKPPWRVDFSPPRGGDFSPREPRSRRGRRRSQGPELELLFEPGQAALEGGLQSATGRGLQSPRAPGADEGEDTGIRPGATRRC